MNATKNRPRMDEIARDALRRAAGPGEPDVGRLVEAAPRILAEARRRRASRTRVDPVISTLVSLARGVIPRLAAAAAMLVLLATFLGFRDAPETADAGDGLDRYILTGEITDDASDLLLEALVDQGKNHG